MQNRFAVRQGQRYVQRPGAHCRPAIWEVGAIHSGAVPIPHARLVNVEDPLCTKTISCGTLANPTFYELIADARGTAQAQRQSAHFREHRSQKVKPQASLTY